MLVSSKRLLVFICFISCYQMSKAISCDKVNQCVCEMSDGSGTINLRSVGERGFGAQTPAFEVDGGDGWFYRYNPCYSFSSISYTDLAILQVSLDGFTEYNLGIQATEKFEYSAATGVSIKYDDNTFFPERNSSVLLICNTGVEEHLVEFLGELITTEYEFILNGPCACPGVCDDNGIIVPTTTTDPITTTTTDPTITTTTTNTTTTTTLLPTEPEIPEIPDTGFNWDHMGNVLAGLIFHDFILVFTIVAVMVVLRFVFNFDFSRDQSRKPAFSEA